MALPQMLERLKNRLAPMRGSRRSNSGASTCLANSTLTERGVPIIWLMALDELTSDQVYGFAWRRIAVE